MLRRRVPSRRGASPYSATDNSNKPRRMARLPRPYGAWVSNVSDNSKKLPLIAGNWKMHCNHLEAIALVQKLAFTLTDKDYRHVELVVLPPFTDLRSVQTLVDGDKLKIGYG